jgi:Holliday junction resolvase RusA-like endonuclease
MGLDPRWLAVIEGGTAAVTVGPSAVVPGEPQDSVTISVPPSVNNLYLTAKTGRRVLTPSGRAWKDEAVIKLKAMRKPERYPVTVHWTINEWVRVNRDGANTEKALVDCMVEAGILAADDVRHIVGETWSYRPVEGGVGVTVWWEYAEETAEKPKTARRRKTGGTD